MFLAVSAAGRGTHLMGADRELRGRPGNGALDNSTKAYDVLQDLHSWPLRGVEQISTSVDQDML